MKKVLSYFILYLFLSVVTLTAQNKDIQYSMKLGVGLGVNSEIERNPTMSGLINANISVDNLLISVRNVKMYEFISFFNSKNYFKEYARDVALLVGYRDRTDDSYYDASIGIASNSGLKRGPYTEEAYGSIGLKISNEGNYEKIWYSNLGIAFELSLFYDVKEKRAWGITFLGNLNERNPFFGLVLNISVFHRNKK